MNSQAATQEEIRAGIKSLVYVALGIQSHTTQAQQVKALLNIILHNSSFQIPSVQRINRQALLPHTMCMLWIPLRENLSLQNN